MARILVIEKKSSISMIVQKILENVGHEVYALDSCTEAAKFSTSLDIDIVIFNVSIQLNSERVAFGLLRKNYQDKHFIGLMDEDLCFAMNAEIMSSLNQKYFRPLIWEKVIEDINKIKISNSTAIRRNVMLVDNNKNTHDKFKKILCNNIEFNNSVDLHKNEVYENAANGKASSEKFDYHVISAFNGKESIGIIKNHKGIGCPIDVIFMDAKMASESDGVDACCQIKKIYPEADLIFCSDYSDYSANDLLNKVGNKKPVYFVPKPFEASRVHKVLSQIRCKEDIQIA